MSFRHLSIWLAVPVVIFAVAVRSEQIPNLSTFFPLSNVSTPTPPVDSSQYLLSSHSDLVLLDVSVKNPKGGFISGLTKGDFKVFDNNVEQPILVFEAGDVPVTIGLVVDNSGSMRMKKAEVVTAALTFATESNPKDEMFVVNFNDRVRMGLPPNIPFTDDRNLLRAALINNPVAGRTALNDALKLALAHLEQGRQDKKTLVLISDGGDNASELTQADIMHLAEKSRATIYTVGIFDADDHDKNPGFLKKLARLTGGECYLPERLDQMVDVCRRIAKDIRNRYAVGFIPPDSGVNGSVRSLRVVAVSPERGKLTVRTRTHYVGATAKRTETSAAKPAGNHP